MDRCDVLVVGGGPAGASCAWRLRRAGLDVVVLDRARFPRDKVCAGWVTPQVLTALEIDLDDYARGRTLEPVTGFRVGIIGQARDTTIRYGRPVSVGIRRCEFDDYLLHRSGARLCTGGPVTSIARDGHAWIINGSLRTPMLVGAGGHFCPVARRLNPEDRPTAVVAAQEIEVPLTQVRPGRHFDPKLVALYFSRDLTGYGWCFRKQGFVNIGFGQDEGAALPKAVESFVAFLGERDIVQPDPAWRWHGHAYRVYPDRRRRVAGDGVLLIGDAAGLAYPESGEGIRPAIESALLAASTIIAAGAAGRYAARELQPYEERLARRLGAPARSVLVGKLTARIGASVAPAMLASSWLVRKVLLDRWFLHAAQPALAA